MNIDFDDFSRIFVKDLEKFGFRCEKKTDARIEFHKKNNWYFELYLDRYRDGYYFNLCNDKSKKKYAVWILAKILSGDNIRSEDSLVKFIGENFSSMISNFSEIEEKYAYYDQLIINNEYPLN